MAAIFRGITRSVSKQYSLLWTGNCRNSWVQNPRFFSITQCLKDDEIKYSKSHEWACLSGTTAKVGISDYAQDKLGEVVYVDLPDIGLEVEAGEYFGAVESVKAASDLNSPLPGKVLAVNKVLVDNPEVINKSPTDEGWIMEINVSDASELDNLLTKEEYEKFLESDESH